MAQKNLVDGDSYEFTEGVQLETFRNVFFSDVPLYSYSSPDMNNMTTTGMWMAISSSDPDKHQPPDIYSYGWWLVIVLKLDSSLGGTIKQIAVSLPNSNNGVGANGGIYVRGQFGSQHAWNNWEKLS